MSTAIIAGHDSELGSLVAATLLEQHWKIIGTSRRMFDSEFDSSKNLYYCDFIDRSSISQATKSIIEANPDWDLLVLSVGILDPLGLATDVNFDDWEASIKVNFINQFYFIREIIRLTKENSAIKRRVLTFAGSGTNSAPKNYSAYTLSKIALIKSMELLAAENPSYCFISLGTGWMKSKIHDQTILAGEELGDAYYETLRRQTQNDFGKPEDLQKFIGWVLEQPTELISGRNFSLQGDDWEGNDFLVTMNQSQDSYKLRRSPFK